MPAPLEDSSRSGLVPQFTRSRYCVPPPPEAAPDASQPPPLHKLTQPSRIWAMDPGGNLPPLSRTFRKEVRRKGWSKVLERGVEGDAAERAPSDDAGSLEAAAAEEVGPRSSQQPRNGIASVVNVPMNMAM